MNKIDSIDRTVSSLSLDGRRLSVDIRVEFRRSLPPNEANQVGDDVARAIDSILSEQIVQGQNALGSSELEVMTLARAKLSAPKIKTLQIRHLRTTVHGPAAPAPASPRPEGPAQPRRSVTPTPASHSPVSSQAAPVSGIESVDVEAVGAKGGGVLRDAAARVLLAALSAMMGRVTDRFAVLEGQAPSAALRRSTAACLAAIIYSGLKSGGASHKNAAAIVDSVCRHAHLAESPSASEIGEYLASARPAEELARKFVALLDAPHEEALVLNAIAPHCSGLAERFRVVSRRSSASPPPTLRATKLSGR
jgi:hypothetical protein